VRKSLEVEEYLVKDLDPEECVEERGQKKKKSSYVHPRNCLIVVINRLPNLNVM